ncbi:MAG: hypothetical protein WBP83_00720, partial [Nitrososphaeraceae archaeon]
NNDNTINRDDICCDRMDLLFFTLLIKYASLINFSINCIDAPRFFSRAISCLTKYGGNGY